jgi:DUF2950 family protein
MTMHAIARRSGILCLGLTVAATAFAATPAKQKKFDTPEHASEALIAAAGNFDLDALKEILGPDGVDLVVTGDPVLDKNQAVAFAEKAREAHHVVRDPKHPDVVTLSIGEDDWPVPIPIVRDGSQWRLDTKAGRQEILFRRIGNNELDAIEVCHGYVEAQEEYASEKRDGSSVNQYAQRVISTPGRHDGLAWQDPDGSWQGPVGEEIARAIAEGYTEGIEPYHGYHFRILKAQGPHARLGSMNFVVNGVMIGGFALVAAPAEYRVTGIKTFIVSIDGVVYEKDLGPETRQAFREMSRFDPDSSWHPVKSQ